MLLHIERNNEVCKRIILVGRDLDIGGTEYRVEDQQASSARWFLHQLLLLLPTYIAQNVELVVSSLQGVDDVSSTLQYLFALVSILRASR